MLALDLVAEPVDAAARIDRERDPETVQIQRDSLSGVVHACRDEV